MPGSTSPLQRKILTRTNIQDAIPTARWNELFDFLDRSPHSPRTIGSQLPRITLPGNARPACPDGISTTRTADEIPHISQKGIDRRAMHTRCRSFSIVCRFEFFGNSVNRVRRSASDPYCPPGRPVMSRRLIRDVRWSIPGGSLPKPCLSNSQHITGDAERVVGRRNRRNCDRQLE